MSPRNGFCLVTVKPFLPAAAFAEVSGGAVRGFFNVAILYPTLGTPLPDSVVGIRKDTATNSYSALT